MRDLRATNTTAFISGIWLGLLNLAHLFLAPNVTQAVQEKLFIGVAIFGLGPALGFVIGLDIRKDFSSATTFVEIRDIFLRLGKRALFWFLGVAVIGFPVSFLLRF